MSEYRKPNVVFILTDDQGYGDLGCHGNPVIQSPNIDRLHGESVRFTDFHVSPVCSPTRAQLMTGCYPSRLGVWRTVAGRSILRKEWKTMADIFRDNGYKTAIFGKWHLGDNYPYRPQDRGFDEVLVHGGGGVGNINDYWGNDYFDDVYFRNGKPEQCKGFCTDVWFSEAIKFIENHRDRPFFCYISTNAPHLPFVCPEEYKQLYANLEPGLREFAAMITHIDKNVGILRKRLRDLNLDGNTILIFMTDNGTARGATLWNAGMRGWKGHPYDGGHRVPFFLHWPGGEFNQGKEISRLTGGIDLLPTLIDLCQMENTSDRPFDGRSVAPLLKGNETAWPDRTIIIDNQQRSIEPEYFHFSTAILHEKWRMIRQDELYDIAKDPSQTNNLIQIYPETAKNLSDQYSRWFEENYGDRSPAEIVVGNNKENPVRLTAHDLFVNAA